MKILVVGGLGYLGSHIVTALALDHEVVICDEISSTHEKVVARLRTIAEQHLEFIHVDLRIPSEIDEVLSGGEFEAVVHCAEYNTAIMSVEVPLDYYIYNVGGTLNLLQSMRTHGIKKLVYSSSAQVYGSSGSEAIKEDCEISPLNPYGHGKAQCEQIISDLAESDPEFCAISLRYFNAVGSHESGIIGDQTGQGAFASVLPVIEQVALGNLPELTIFGNDYQTPDGTGQRDYTHIMDVAEGHVVALGQLNPGHRIYNLGTGQGTTVIELCKAYEMISDKKIQYSIGQRRPGEVDSLLADVSLAEEELGWKATRDIIHICTDSWNWIKNNPNGYD